MIPQHVTIIMDGNGRWAQQRGMTRIFGHNNALDAIRDCTEYCVYKGIRYLSLYAFSEENWNRPAEEVAGLMKLMMKCMVSEAETFKKNNVRFRVIGNLARLDEQVRQGIRKLEDMTADNNALDLILMISYSGKWDIIQAMNRYIDDRKDDSSAFAEPVTEALLEPYLATAGIPDPDLMIRTSGEQRISNYMLWQCAYSEFYFTDVLWPDFRKTDFQKALDSYEKRDRRYGKIK